MVLNVNASSPYDVVIESGIANKSGDLISKIVSPCKALILTDSLVPKTHSKKVQKSLGKLGYMTFIYTIPSGESSKSQEQFFNVLSYLAEKGFSRKDVLISVGGGVVGDLGGFVASTYMRGIKFINFPTTLLSCIDSSIGGKTAINLPIGKNLVGTFYQPSLVVVDTDFLNTLPNEIFLDGLGEAIKYGLMDKLVWDKLKGNVKDNLEDFIYDCLKIKKYVVEQDEKEGGLRQILNLGHTFAHAIETLSNYTVMHGFAVVKGLVLVCKLSLKNGDLNKEQFDEIINVISSYNIDFSCNFSLKDMKEVMLKDKKANNGTVNLIYPEKIGKVSIKKFKIEEINI